MTRSLEYPDRQVPEMFFHNAVELEATLFENPNLWINKDGMRLARSRVCFQGYKLGADGVERIPQTRVSIAVWCREDTANDMAMFKEGDRVLIEGWFTTRDYETDLGEHGVKLALLVREIRKVDFYFDRSTIREKRSRKKA